MAVKASNSTDGRRTGHTVEERMAAARRVIGGVPKARVARDMGITRQTLYVWIDDYKKSAAYATGDAHDEAASENIRNQVQSECTQEPDPSTPDNTQ